MSRSVASRTETGSQVRGGPHFPLPPSPPAPAATPTHAIGVPRGQVSAVGAVGAETVLTASGLYKRYRRGSNVVEVLRGVDLQVQRGEFVSVVGQSGSGKSTLLHLLGTLDRPDSGEIRLGGQRIDDASSGQRERLRNQTLGMVFQFYHLLPELTALENVLLAGMIRGGMWGYWQRRSSLRRQATELLHELGLEHRAHHRPSELSGGEMQRVAIARALVTQPEVLLADEPTGNLDRQTGEGILRILRRLNTQRRLTIVMVTHDQSLAQASDRTLRLVEGRMAA